MQKDSISSFRGYAGEVVANVMGLGTWAIFVPLGFFWLLVGLLTYLLVDKLGFGLVGLYSLPVLGAAFVVARFAIPATQGEFKTGFLTSPAEFAEVGAFVVRLLTALILWELPLCILVYVSSVSLWQAVGIGSLVGGGVIALWALLLFLLILLGPGIASILAAATNEVGAIFNRELWLWLFISRRSDLYVFYAGLLGGAFVFFALYLLPVAAVLMFLASQSMWILLSASSLLFLVPGMASQILIGRLAGAFIFGSDRLREEQPYSSVTQQSQPAPPSIQTAETSTAAPVSSPSTTQSIESLPFDPSHDLVEWIRQTMAAQSDVVAAHLYQRQPPAEDGSTVVLGIELAADAKLAAKQSVLRAIKAGASSNPLLQGKVSCSLIDGALLEQVRDVGLRVYQKKSD